MIYYLFDLFVDFSDSRCKDKHFFRNIEQLWTNFCSTVIDFQGVGLLQGLFHVADESHRRVTVCTETHRQTLGILWGELAADGIDAGWDL